MALAFDAQASATGSAGAQASVSLTGIATGSLMVLWAFGQSATAPIADPAGWTRIARATVGTTNIHWLGYRVKVGGDTAVAIGGGAGQTVAGVWACSGGATFGQASALVSGTGTSTTIDPDPLTIVAATSISLVVASGPGASSSTPPSGWTERVDASFSGINTDIQMAEKSGLSAGSLDPGVVTFNTSTTDRAAYHIEIVPGTVPVNADRRIPYVVNQQTGQSRITPWTVTGSIGADRRIPYGVGGSITSDRRIPYVVLTSVGLSRIVKWTDLVIVSDTRRLPYAVTGAITADRRVNWTVNGPVYATRDLRWIINGEQWGGCVCVVITTPTIVVDITTPTITVDFAECNC